MKSSIVAICLALSTSLSAFAQAPKPAAPAKPAAQTTKDPLKGLRSSRDEMRGITWYEHPSSPRQRNANGFHLYFGKEDDGRFTHLRLVMQYSAETWLFISSAWAKADTTRVNLPSEKKFTGWNRDNASGNIWEWSDVQLISGDDKASVRYIATSKNVTVRFEGKQYYSDKKLTDRQLSAMREVIAAYEAATGRPWN